MPHALLLQQYGSPFEHMRVGGAPKYSPGLHEVLVRVRFVGLNPVDWKCAQQGALLKHPQLPTVLGCDAEGVVEELGPQVGPDIKKGDEVLVLGALGRGAQYGTFQEYVVVPVNAVVKRPANIPPAAGPTFGCAAITAFIALFDLLKFPSTATKSIDELKIAPGRNDWILIWGGASCVGQFLLQLSHLLGLRTITTASKQNFEIVKALGADEILDYRENEDLLVEKIRKITNNSLKFAVDNISSETAGLCARALSKAENRQPAMGAEGESFKQRQGATAEQSMPHLVATAGLPPKDQLPSDITAEMFLVLDYFNTPESRRRLHEHMAEMSRLAAENILKPTNIQDLGDGLDKIPEGLHQLAEGHAHCAKMIAKVTH